MSGLGRILRRSSAPSAASDAAPSTGEAGATPRVAVLTVVRDEARMLPLWLRHYGREVGHEHLYVVDDGSTDGSTEHLPCAVLRVPPVREGRFESTRMRLVSGLADGLLALYDAVVFCDADEFLVADPERFDGLADLVAARSDQAAIGALALNVVHRLVTEEPLDLGRPVLGQRRYAVFVPTMCKPAVNLSGARWVAASHGIRAPYRVDPALFMFHLKFADRGLLHEAAEKRRAVVELDGRSKDTSWRRGGDELVGLLERVSARIDDTVAEFRVPGLDRLEGLVVADEQHQASRARRGGQVKAMEQRPVVRIPERFFGRL